MFLKELIREEMAFRHLPNMVQVSGGCCGAPFHTLNCLRFEYRGLESVGIFLFPGQRFFSQSSLYSED